MYDSEHSRWQAVQSRCKAADAAFVYAVVTTKIFCRPTCPARLARRANVKFYDTSVNALKSGFRPCKRCKPDQVHLVGTDITKPQKEVVKKACAYIDEMKGETTLKDIAHNVGISARYLHGVFKEITGSTPAVYAARVKNENTSLAVSNESSPSSLDSAATTLPSTTNYSDFIDDTVCETRKETGDMDFAFYTSVESYEAAEEQLNGLYGQHSGLSWDLEPTLVDPMNALGVDWEKGWNGVNHVESFPPGQQLYDTDMEAVQLPVDYADTWPELDMSKLGDWSCIDFEFNQPLQTW